MIVLGYITAILIGVSLGLIGAGGSILTVPILVYLMGISPVLATSYSLFIVGISALVGSYSYMKKKLLNFRMALIFGIPSVVGVLVSRKFILPAIPKELFTIKSFVFTKDIGIMIFFAVLMIISAVKMIQKPKDAEEPITELDNSRNLLISFEGLLVGIIAGFVGAGGGFLIIPVLVVIARQPMKNAIGTSLFIIAVNSLIGFTGDLYGHVEINWNFLALFSSFALAGIFVGSWLSKFISGTKLKPIFGWMVLLMGIYIIAEKSFNS